MTYLNGFFLDQKCRDGETSVGGFDIRYVKLKEYGFNGMKRRIILSG
jgi:hypothetical protein